MALRRPGRVPIAEVYEFATRETTPERRHTFATLIRSRLVEPPPARIVSVVSGLEALASELDDADIELDPLARLPASGC